MVNTRPTTVDGSDLHARGVGRLQCADLRKNETWNDRWAEALTAQDEAAVELEHTPWRECAFEPVADYRRGASALG